ncbi:MAG: hypothetical protein ACE5PO_07995 [Candidatus Bathyarchaeia archaeon]
MALELIELTSIRRVVRRQYYRKLKGGWKRRYECVRFRFEFPAEIDVSDLAGKEQEVKRVGDELTLKPKASTESYSALR